MFNVCPRCGRYAEEKAVDPAGPYAVCPHCGYAHPFRRSPLFVVTGASGAGKSTVSLPLAGTLPGCVVFETDILWCPELDTPDDDWERWRMLWVRIAKNVAQSGLASVLCGTFLPQGIEPLAERRFLGTVHYLALVCGDAELADRLRARPAWRQSGDDAFVERMVAFNGWLREHAATTDPPMTLLDTTGRSVEETVSAVRSWVVERLGESA